MFSVDTGLELTELMVSLLESSGVRSSLTVCAYITAYVCPQCDSQHGDRPTDCCCCNHRLHRPLCFCMYPMITLSAESDSLFRCYYSHHPAISSVRTILYTSPFTRYRLTASPRSQSSRFQHPTRKTLRQLRSRYS